MLLLNVRMLNAFGFLLLNELLVVLDVGGVHFA